MQLFFNLWNRTGREVSEVPKLVLLHGMGGTGALWRPLAASLEDDIAILAPDQRGHGRSRAMAGQVGGQADNGTTDYDPLAYGQDVIDTLAHENFHSTWILGHSMGVRTAVAAAHLKPEWCKGLILIDIGFSGPAGGGLGDHLASFLKLLPQEFSSREEARQFMIQNCPDPSIAQYLMAVSVKDATGKVSFPFDHSALIQTVESVRGFSLRPWLEELTQKGIPILALRGEKSLVWNRKDFEAEQQHFDSAIHQGIMEFIEIPEAGHGLPFEKRTVVAELIKKKVRMGKLPSN